MGSSTSFSMSLSILASNLRQFHRKNHFKKIFRERKTGIRAVWPKLSVLDCSLSHRCSLTISEWNCFLYLHKLGRAKHRYPVHRGFSPTCLYGFIVLFIVRVACTIAYLLCIPRNVNKPTWRQASHANDFVIAKSHAREKVRAEDLINYPSNRVSFNLPR